MNKQGNVIDRVDDAEPRGRFQKKQYKLKGLGCWARSLTFSITRNTNEDDDGFQLARFTILTGHDVGMVVCPEGHVVEKRAPRFDGNSWSCDGCGAGYEADPGFEFYTCTNTNHASMDWCENCFENIENFRCQEPFRQELDGYGRVQFFNEEDGCDSDDY